MSHILFLVHENAADLFPRKVARSHRETQTTGNFRKRPKMERRGSILSQHMARPIVDMTLDSEGFPEELHNLAYVIHQFLVALYS